MGTFAARVCCRVVFSQQRTSVPDFGKATSRKKVGPRSNRSTTGIASRTAHRSFGKEVIESWLDLAKLVSASGSDTRSAFSELADDLGKDIYVDINGWHLYLRDITVAPGLKMNHALANQLGSRLLNENLGDKDIESLLQQVPLVLGGGKLKVQLAEALPQFCVDDFIRICKDFADRA